MIKLHYKNMNPIVLLKVRFFVIAIFLCATGCSADKPANPSFALTYSDAKAALAQMRKDPKPLLRPLIIAGGYQDPGLIAPGIANRFRRLTDDSDNIISITYFSLIGSFDACSDKLIESVQQQFPNEDPSETIEVDVIGYSMGGLVARHAARPRDGVRRLRINRLFTISTPHRGANLAEMPTADERQLDMRSGSAFLVELNQQLGDCDYELFTYSRLDDLIVGVENTSPPGVNPWWVANPPFSLAHVAACKDPRILADIARRVRGEAAYATTPAAALPSEAPQRPENP